MVAPKSLAAAALLLLSGSSAQPQPISEFFNITYFPNEQHENVTQFLNEAAALATDGSIHQYFQDTCITQQKYPRLFTNPPGFVQPFSPFDNLYFVGHSSVSAWAYNTTEGLVLIDTLDNPTEVQEILLPSLQSLGFRGSDIKHVIITHEHLDHYGGVRYLQEQFSPKIYASSPAWDNLESLGPNANPAPPLRNQTVSDGEDLTIGGVDFHIITTPGHTPGCISLVFPVYENRKRHVVGFQRGTGNPRALADREEKVRSGYKLARISYAMGADTLMSNHQIADHALYNADQLAHRTRRQPNPFIIGVKNYNKYVKINAICTKVLMAREGQDFTI